jgi:hypothetical protein
VAIPDNVDQKPLELVSRNNFAKLEIGATETLEHNKHSLMRNSGRDSED